MSQRGFWIERGVDGMTAAAEAIFPDNDFGAPDWRSTELVPRMIEYIDELPPPERRLLWALFVFVELAAILLVFGFRRFSRLDVKRRTEAIRRWRSSRLLPFRVLGDALKASTTMIYMSHPSVIAYIAEYRSCDNAHDALRIAVRAAEAS